MPAKRKREDTSEEEEDSSEEGILTPTASKKVYLKIFKVEHAGIKKIPHQSKILKEGKADVLRPTRKAPQAPYGPDTR